MSLKRSVWRRLRRILPVVGEAFAAPSIKQALIDQEIRALRTEIASRTPGNPALYGFKVFSQVDEDGIIEYIFKQIGATTRTFIELGCGNGSENNTHYLALQQWSGVWVDGSKENIDHILSFIPRDASDLLVHQMFITRENIADSMRSWLARLKNNIDLLSIDIDGNDAEVLRQIIAVTKPRVLVVEYNGKFPPPLRLSVAYNPSHGWGGDDYYGSSLQVFVDLLTDYRLVSCGLSGANAYFVRLDAAAALPDWPVQSLYMHARHHLIQKSAGAVASLKYLSNVLRPDSKS